MRFSSTELSTLNKFDLIQVLQEGQTTISRAEQIQLEYNQVIDQINAVNAQSQVIANGNPKKKSVIVAAISGALGFILSKAAIIAVFIAAIVTAAFLFIDKRAFASKHQEEAKAYENRMLPPLEEKQQQLQQAAASLVNSDSYSNISQLLPEEYQSSETVHALLSLLQTNRASTLGEAINFYEDQQHRARMENIEMQKLQAAQIAAQAQVRSADAQERSATAQMSTAKSMKSMVKEQRRTTDAINSASRGLSSQRQVQAVSSSESSRGMVTCRSCKKKIDRHAQVCPYCGRDTDYSSTISGIFSRKLGL